MGLPTKCRTFWVLSVGSACTFCGLADAGVVGERSVVVEDHEASVWAEVCEGRDAATARADEALWLFRVRASPHPLRSPKHQWQATYHDPRRRSGAGCQPWVGRWTRERAARVHMTRCACVRVCVCGRIRGAASAPPPPTTSIMIHLGVLELDVLWCRVPPSSRARVHRPWHDPSRL